jgi:hypothetical protein
MATDHTHTRAQLKGERDGAKQKPHGGAYCAKLVFVYEELLVFFILFVKAASRTVLSRSPARFIIAS